MLDPLKVKALMEAGQPDKGIQPRQITNNHADMALFEPYDHLFAPYEHEERALYYCPPGMKHPFSKLHRMKLIWNLLRGPHNIGGCDLHVEELLKHDHIYAMYPLHNNDMADKILNLSANQTYILPWHYPFDDIKQYFGERFTLHLQLLGHFALWMIPAAFLGLIVQIVVFATLDFSSPILPFFGIIMAAWSIIMLEYWKRNESFISLKWGTTTFEQTEQNRPEFWGTEEKSFIDGADILYYPEGRRRRQYMQNAGLIFLSVLVILGIVSSIYTLRFYLVDNGYELSASVIASCINSVQILVTNVIYKKAAWWMTAIENQRTFTEFEDSLIVKTFVFLFINSYSSFFYIAFVAMYIAGPDDESSDNEGSCGYESCMEPLAINLAIIFFANMAQQFVNNYFLPKLLGWKKKKDETKGVEDKALTPAEKDYILMECDPLHDSINNYSQVAVEYGYMILFISALPIALLFGYVSTAIRQRLLVWRQFRLYQRIIPTTAQDIGTWQDIFNILSVVSVVTNGALICFTMDVLDNKYFSTSGRIWIFVGIQWTLIGLQALISVFIPDEPMEVTVQKKRMDFINAKCIRHEEDHESSNLKVGVSTRKGPPRTWYEKILGVMRKHYPDEIKSSAHAHVEDPDIVPRSWPPNPEDVADVVNSGDFVVVRGKDGSIRLASTGGADELLTKEVAPSPAGYVGVSGEDDAIKGDETRTPEAEAEAKAGGQ